MWHKAEVCVKPDPDTETRDPGAPLVGLSVTEVTTLKVSETEPWAT
jgi:hypothetical protein